MELSSELVNGDSRNWQEEKLGGKLGSKVTGGHKSSIKQFIFSMVEVSVVAGALGEASMLFLKDFTVRQILGIGVNLLIEAQNFLNSERLVVFRVRLVRASSFLYRR